MSHVVADCTVVITTRNRRDELRCAITSCFTQNLAPKVLVIDDGSTDGTSEMVSREFPAVQLECSEKPFGLVVQRNRGAAIAKTTYILSIDDDAVLASPTIIEQTIAAFDHPRVGAVAIPYVNLAPATHEAGQRAPNDKDVWVCEHYIGTAHALRRDVFIALGGYREMLHYQCEERDFCIRLLDAGYVTRVGWGDYIHHSESPRRDRSRIDRYRGRNFVLFGWHNAPWSRLPTHLAGTTFNQLRAARRSKPWRLVGLVDGYCAILSHPTLRRPVSIGAYRAYRQLQYNGHQRLFDIESLLPQPLLGGSTKPEHELNVQN